MALPDPKHVFAKSLAHCLVTTMRRSCQIQFTGAEPCCHRHSRPQRRRRRLWRGGAGGRRIVAVAHRAPASVRVDMRRAAVEFRSERYSRVDGRVPDDITTTSPDFIAAATAASRGCIPICRTIAAASLKLLGVAHDKAAVQRALDGMTAEALETAAAEAGPLVTACRSFAEWDQHPQGQAVAKLPLLSIEQIGEAPVKASRTAQRPLAA